MSSPFNIQNAIAEFGDKGLIRPNKFLVTTVLPNVLQGTVFNDLTTGGGLMSLWAESATLPGAMLEMAPLRRYGYGPIENKPWSAKFTDIQVMFRADAKGIIHGFLHQWMQAAVNYNYDQDMSTSQVVGASESQSWEVNYKDDYVSTVTISVFDDQGGLNPAIQDSPGFDQLQPLGSGDSSVYPAIQIFLRDAFPVAVGDVPLSWGARGEYVKFPVQFSFFSWYSARTPGYQGSSQGS